MAVIVPVEIPQVAEVIQVNEVMSLESAVDRLARIQEMKRILEKEEKALRAATIQTMERAGIKGYTTTEGATATVYESAATSWDAEYLRETLTEDEMKKARKSSPFKAIRIA